MTYIHLAIGVRVSRLNGGASRPVSLAQISQSGIVYSHRRPHYFRMEDTAKLNDISRSNDLFGKQ